MNYSISPVKEKDAFCKNHLRMFVPAFFILHDFDAFQPFQPSKPVDQLVDWRFLEGLDHQVIGRKIIGKIARELGLNNGSIFFGYQVTNFV